MSILVLVAGPAFACPTIATGTPSPLSFDTAQVAIVRDGDRTTFSVSINPKGDPQGFALVLPVPEVLAEDEIRTLDPNLFYTLDAFTAPRTVADAGCAQPQFDQSGSDDSAGSAEGPSETGDVTVEAEYLVGEYQVVILSADQSVNLEIWLESNGYHLPEGANDRLREYIDAGSYFLAARVADTAAVADGTPLSPLQLSYQSPVYAIPIRLAALNSPGVQDMVIYAMGRRADGVVGISNYTGFEVKDQCIWGDPATDDFAQFYKDRFVAAWTGLEDAGWAVEFAGGLYDCSPCTSVFPTEDDIAAIGFAGDSEDFFLTRLKVRYTPDQADADLSLYASGLVEPSVLSFADDNSLNRDCIDACRDPIAIGGCGGDGEGHVTSDGKGGSGAGCGCDAGGAGGSMLVVGIAAALRRRKR